MLQVTLRDGRELSARVLALDSGLDLAALAVEADGLPTIELGDSRGLRPGQLVLAMGHPWGVSGAVAAGAVIGTGPRQQDTPSPEREWIVAGLRLRPGHSGGPMMDVQGRLVGINTMITGPQVAMAVPVHVVKDFLSEALREERSRRRAAQGRA
jgi:S1-C subfamily serine protease